MNITKKDTTKLLTNTNGYLTGYTFSLNPYTGCAFSCSYCYVRRMPVALFKGEEWGSWVNIKNNAKDLYSKEIKRARKKHESIAIFMSSSTDPYQPIEAKEKLTRSLLKVMLEEEPDFLFVQTRSPLVARDIDLLKTVGNKVLVSVTIETDREDIRKRFSPAAPPIPARINALSILKNAGIPTQAAIAPILPSTPQFASKLSKVVDRITIDDYFNGDGSKGKRTKSLKIESLYEPEELKKWYETETIYEFASSIKQVYKSEQIFESQEGFLPPNVVK